MGGPMLNCVGNSTTIVNVRNRITLMFTGMDVVTATTAVAVADYWGPYALSCW
jgi:hypothetical protein